VDDLLTLSRPAMRARRPELVPAIVIGVVVAVLFVLAALSMRTPDQVHLTVDNPLDWRADVAVQPAGSDSWTSLGAVARDGELEFLQVPDQGSEWVVRFSYGDQVEELRLSRSDLEGAGWTVQVPDQLGTQLQAAGVAPSTGSAQG
jgi:predicted Abi (CAAX) family protease